MVEGVLIVNGLLMIDYWGGRKIVLMNPVGGMKNGRRQTY